MGLGESQRHVLRGEQPGGGDYSEVAASIKLVICISGVEECAAGRTSGRLAAAAVCREPMNDTFLRVRHPTWSNALLARVDDLVTARVLFLRRRTPIAPGLTAIYRLVHAAFAVPTRSSD